MESNPGAWKSAHRATSHPKTPDDMTTLQTLNAIAYTTYWTICGYQFIAAWLRGQRADPQ